MKTQSKPIIALASGAVLLCGVLTQSAHAQAVIDPTTTVTLADVNGNASGPTALPVTYEVTEDTLTDVYTYTYSFSNPSGDTADVVNFQLGFNASQPGAVIADTLSGGSFTPQNNGSTGVEFYFLGGIAPGGSSGTLTFESDDYPTMGNANAGGNNPPGPWASAPDGSPVPVPQIVPEPTSLSLLALGVLVPAFRRGRNFFK